MAVDGRDEGADAVARFEIVETCWATGTVDDAADVGEPWPGEHAVTPTITNVANASPRRRLVAPRQPRSSAETCGSTTAGSPDRLHSIAYQPSYPASANASIGPAKSTCPVPGSSRLESPNCM